uniref:Uncharacterized protein n=2 Tax=Clytia hemisphaerica TaxID=252671 RepID=A0A7M5XHW3_9CNID
MPSPYGGDNRGRVIFIGEGWGGNTHSQSSTLSNVNVVVEVWYDGPTPSFEMHVPIYTTGKSSSRRYGNPLEMVPELISVRVASANKAAGQDYHFHATGSSQVSTKTLGDKSRKYGGLIFGYNHKEIILWGPSKKNGGCIAVGKRWGDGKESDLMFAHNCTVHIRMWVSSFPLPAFQSEWTAYKANQHSDSFIEIKHNLRKYPSLVKVQYRKPYENEPTLIFEGTASVQSTPFSSNKYGGVIYAYNKDSIRIWLPTSSSKSTQAYAIYVGDGWVKNKNIKDDHRDIEEYSEEVELRVLVYADICPLDDEVVDAQRTCRRGSETEITQVMSLWNQCSNPCGEGRKTRNVKECSGKGLQEVMRCNFAKDFCGFTRSGFDWIRTKGKKGNSKYPEIPFEGYPAGSYFVYANSTFSKFEYGKATLTSPVINHGENCVLQFHYNAMSYFGYIYVSAKTNDGKWHDYVWRFKDSVPMKGLWRKGFINFGVELTKPIIQIKFVHRLEAHMNGCPDQCNPVSIADIRMECERPDSFKLTTTQCQEQEKPSAGCFVNAFRPYHKGPAWKVNKTTINSKGEDIGRYIVADGKEGDEIATYRVRIPRTGLYMVWFENFCTSFNSNDVTIVFDDDTYTTATFFNLVTSMWSPISRYYKLSAGDYPIILKQKEAGFRYKNMMVVPKDIDVWGTLGLQNRLIPDNGFSALYLSGYDLTLLDYMLFARLNSPAAWMPTDMSVGKFYLQISLPNIAMINRLAIQGGHGINNKDVKCWTDEFQVKYSLDTKNFQWYRNDTTDEKQFTFKNVGLKAATYQKVIYHNFFYTLVARAVRMYPTHYQFSGCMAIELYGHYISEGLCPQLVTKSKEATCTGNGNCGSDTKQCVPDKATNSSVCGCKTGYHGNDCRFTGCENNPCINGGKCVMQKGTEFKCDCPAGLTGKFCEKKCPTGYYGRNCLYKCSCVGFCDSKTGVCNCKAGLMGQYCNEPCPNGLYGVGCVEKCSCDSYMKCNPVNGHCACAAGFYSNKCEKQCEDGFYGEDCKHKCSCENGVCDRFNGTCACAKGWYGNKCDTPCPQGSYGQGCIYMCGFKPTEVRKKCNPVNGHMICVAGYRGNNCEHPCDPFWYGEDCTSKCTCMQQNTNMCDPQKGQCICKPGFRGENCEHPCDGTTWGVDCKNQCLCKNGADCDAVTGDCTCIRGFQGAQCESKCDVGTYGDGCTEKCFCSKAHSDGCSHSDGTCICKQGYTGTHCTEKCSRNRWGRNCREKCLCVNGANCDHLDGFCDCQPGFQGQYCAQECPQGLFGEACMQSCLCKNNAHCDSVSGACTCLDGFYGEHCEKKCSPGFYGHKCLNKCKCDVNNSIECGKIKGTCFCKPGFVGEFCTEECPYNMWGEGCNQVCYPCRHADGTCDKRDGNCTCAAGFTGTKCDNDCPRDHFGRACLEKCNCASGEICHNVDGTCYTLDDHTLNVMFKIDKATLSSRKYYFRENLEVLFGQCYYNYKEDMRKYPDQNITETRRCRTSSRELGSFIVRVIEIKEVYTEESEPVSLVTIVVQNGTTALSSEFLRDFFVYMGKANIDNTVTYAYYTGQTFEKQTSAPWYNSHLKFILIGIGAFLFIIVIIIGAVRCTKKIPQPSPFQKIKRSSKDSVELRPCLNGPQSHLLAFQNPYYDVIAAMGLDDDIEEDYYNPLYEVPSDSETDPDDMYFTYRTNRRHFHPRNQFPYDKDSGFSSGTLM